MALVTIRNPEMAHNRTVIADEALKNGMVVKLVQGDKGDPCHVAKITAAADLTDSTIVKGIVTFVADNDLTVDFILDPTNEALSLNTDSDNSTDIAEGALCVFWYNKPLVGYHSLSPAVDTTLDFSTAREADVVAVEESNSKVAALDTGMSSTSSHAVGMIYEHEGAELTILFHLL
jgi:hypothetical protein